MSSQKDDLPLVDPGDGPLALGVTPYKDDQKQYHVFWLKTQRVSTPARYFPRNYLGSGAYGLVFCAYDRDKIDPEKAPRGVKRAVKMINSLFDGNLIDAKRILREVKLLAHFRHPNILRAYDVFSSSLTEELKTIGLVTDIMETDLHKVIYGDSELSEEHLKYFTYQLLYGLHHMHSAGVVHRDLKPANLFVNGDCHLKIGDLGLARSLISDDPDHSEQYITEYVVTRWYRAPEIMYSYETYDYAIDVWSVGCILSEMIMKRPVFPGTDYRNQLELIVKILGTPADLSRISNDHARNYIQQNLNQQPPIPFKTLFNRPNLSAECLDLVGKLLAFFPADRISVTDALNHPWFSEYHAQTRLTPSAKFDGSYEKNLQEDQLDVDTLRSYLCQEIARFRPHTREVFFNPNGTLRKF